MIILETIMMFIVMVAGVVVILEKVDKWLSFVQRKIEEEQKKLEELEEEKEEKPKPPTTGSVIEQPTISVRIKKERK